MAFLIWQQVLVKLLQDLLQFKNCQDQKWKACCSCSLPVPAFSRAMG